MYTSGKHQMHTTYFLTIQFVKLQDRTFFKVKLYSEELKKCSPLVNASSSSTGLPSKMTFYVSEFQKMDTGG